MTIRCSSLASGAVSRELLPCDPRLFQWNVPVGCAGRAVRPLVVSHGVRFVEVVSDEIRGRVMGIRSPGRAGGASDHEWPDARRVMITRGDTLDQQGGPHCAMRADLDETTVVL